MELYTVERLDEALEVLASRGEACQVLAGGTDVMIQLARGEISPSVLLHVERLAELRDAGVNGAARVGSLVTLRRLAKGLLGDRFRAPAEAADTCGGLQTQVVATVGGNVCNASPAADLLPALLVHDAQVTLRSRDGTRTIPLQEFVVGRRATTRRPDELLTELTLAVPGQRSGDVYLKVGRRSAMEVAIVGLAMRLELGDDGTVTAARVALASVAPSPLRSTNAEAALVGSRLEPAALDAAAAAVLGDVTPLDDLRASADYRRRVIPGLLHRAASICSERAGHSQEAGGSADAEGEARWN
jgi:carbon-monoxide dehydrogenase medium subunit